MGTKATLVRFCAGCTGTVEVWLFDGILEEWRSVKVEGGGQNSGRGGRGHQLAIDCRVGGLAVPAKMIDLVLCQSMHVARSCARPRMLPSSFVVPALNGLEGGILKSFQDMSNLEGIEKIFMQGGSVILPAWIHYLAQDLVAATCLVEMNLKDPAGLDQLLMAPVIFIVYLLGPCGFLAYLVLRIISGLVAGMGHVKKS